MSFGAPGYLLLLLLVPFALAGVGVWLRWRSQRAAAFAASTPLRAATIATVGLLVLALGFAAFASARPQIGSRDITVEDRGIDVVIVLDVSQSMYTGDTQPSRLARAQAEINALLSRLQGDRVGLVVFAGDPLVRSPLTSDLGALSRLVDGLQDERGLLPPGSDMGAGVRAGVKLLNGGEAEKRAMLIVSDGEDHAGRTQAAVLGAVSNGWPVYTAGVGTTAGGAVVDIDPESGARIPRIGRDGVPVVTRLDEAGLRAIATDANGRYIALAGDGSPLAGLATELDALGDTTFEQKKSSEPIDRFSMFAWMALALAVEATLLPVVAAPGGWRRAARMLPLAGAGVLIAAVCAGSEAIDLNQRGNREHNGGAYDEAIHLYATAQAIDPSRGEPYYNAANSYSDKGEYTSAIDEAKRALSRLAEAQQAEAEYGLGTHYARSLRFLEAIDAYKRALLADPGDADTKHNLEIITGLLQASPTPTPPPPGFTPEASPTANDGQDQPPDDSSTPGPGDGQPTAVGTPGGAPGTPGAGDGQMSPEQLQRALDEALRGLDEDFTVEEALRTLDLLDQRNRGDLARPPRPGEGAPPDY